MTVVLPGVRPRPTPMPGTSFETPLRPGGGPPGPTGPAGQDSGFTATAGQNLSAGRVVKVLNGVATYWSPGDSADPVGISTTAALSGGSVSIRTGGQYTSPGWGLTPGRQFAGPNGVVSSSPATGRVQPIGEATAADTLVIQFFPSINTL